MLPAGVIVHYPPRDLPGLILDIQVVVLVKFDQAVPNPLDLFAINLLVFSADCVKHAQNTHFEL